MSCYPRNKLRPGRRQSGAALLIAVFVMAICVIMVTGLSTRFVVAVRRAENQLQADQAWYYLTGAEELAIELLKINRREMDKRKGSADDALAPVELFGRYETDDGWLSFNVTDLQGRFNINTLRPPEASVVAPDVPNNLTQRRFIRLLLSLEVPELTTEDAIAITEAIVDWLDGNGLETGFGGAEQAFYAQQPVPYRPADGSMRDISELMLIKGVSPELYRALEPHVTVWPQGGGGINVASASVNVLRALYEPEGLTPLAGELADALHEALQNREIATLSDFLRRPEWGVTPLVPENLADVSELFVISSQTRVGRLNQALDSVVQINENKATVLARSLRML